MLNQQNQQAMSSDSGLGIRLVACKTDKCDGLQWGRPKDESKNECWQTCNQDGEQKHRRCSGTLAATSLHCRLWWWVLVGDKPHTQAVPPIATQSRKSRPNNLIPVWRLGTSYLVLGHHRHFISTLTCNLGHRCTLLVTSATSSRSMRDISCSECCD